MDPLNKTSDTPLYLQLAEVLRAEIRSGNIQPEEKLASEHTLMQQFHVSRMTVRNALSALVAEGLVVTHHGKGSFCASTPGKKNIDVLLNMSDHYFIPYYLQSISSVLEQNHAHLIAADTRNANPEIITRLHAIARQGSNGIIIQGCPKPDWEAAAFSEALTRLKEKGIPVIVIDHAYPLEDVCTAAMDETGIGRMAADYLFRKGHRQVAAICVPQDALSERRFAGFSEIFPDTLQVFHSGEQHSPLLDATAAGVTAFFCYNDTVAQACMDRLKDEGYRIPEDVSIISVDNTILAHAYGITSVAHAKTLIGEYAAEQILSACPQSKIFAPVLVERRSVRQIP